MERNYMAQGGKELIIGGRLTFLDSAEVVNFPEKAVRAPTDRASLEPIADSEATSVSALKADFNALLAALRSAGIIKPNPTPVSEGSDQV